MAEFLTILSGKISSYNLLNYFLPGALLCIILKYIVGYNLLVGNDFENILIFYFVGMIISRVGSLIVEEILRQIKFLHFATYTDFVKAEQADLSKKLTTLSDVNNSFRSYTAVFLISIVAKICRILSYSRCICSDIFSLLGLFSLFILFLFAYRKQTSLVCKRVETMLQNSSTTNDEVQ